MTLDSDPVVGDLAARCNADWMVDFGWEDCSNVLHGLMGGDEGRAVVVLVVVDKDCARLRYVSALVLVSVCPCSLSLNKSPKSSSRICSGWSTAAIMNKDG